MTLAFNQILLKAISITALAIPAVFFTPISRSGSVKNVTAPVLEKGLEKLFEGFFYRLINFQYA